MKLLSPKSVMMCLIILFLLVNIFFLLDYYFFHLNRKNIKTKDKKNNHIDILREYVDFNNTTFENKAGLHFYYGATKRTNLASNITNVIRGKFFKEDKLNILVDHLGRICEDKDFIDHYCRNELSIDILCDSKSMCCEKKFMCISRCIRINSSNIDQCMRICSLSYLTRDTNHPYCHRMDLTDLDYSLEISSFNQSCHDLCLFKNLTCYNNILSLINHCKILEEKLNCTECSMIKNIFGPAVMNASTNLKNSTKEYKCAYTDQEKVSCNYKDETISRICVCL